MTTSSRKVALLTAVRSGRALRPAGRGGHFCSWGGGHVAVGRGSHFSGRLRRPLKAIQDLCGAAGINGPRPTVACRNSTYRGRCRRRPAALPHPRRRMEAAGESVAGPPTRDRPRIHPAAGPDGQPTPRDLRGLHR